MEPLSSMPCGSLRDYLANQELLRRVTEAPLDVVIFDELGLHYEAALSLSPCRRRLVLVDTALATSTAGMSETSHEACDGSPRVARGESWLSIPLTPRTPTVRLSAAHHPYRLEVHAEGVHVAMEQLPRTSMQPLATVLQRLCHSPSVPQANAQTETHRGASPAADRRLSVDAPSARLSSAFSAPRGAASPPKAPAVVTSATPGSGARDGGAVDHGAPSGLMDDLYRSLQAKLEEVRRTRYQLLEMSARTHPVGESLPSAGHSPPTTSPEKHTESSVQRSPDVTVIAPMSLPSASASPPQELPLRDMERIARLERPQAPYSAGHSLNKLGLLGPSAGDVPAMRLYREIHGGSRSSLIEPTLATTDEERDEL